MTEKSVRVKTTKKVVERQYQIKDEKRDLLNTENIDQELINKGKKRLNKKTLEKLKEKDEKDKEKLKIFVERLLKRAVNDKYIDVILNDNNMDIWLSAVTHETYTVGRTDIKPYEELELTGDKCLGLRFLNYLMEKYEENNLKKDQLSQLLMHYMSKQGGGGQGDMIKQYEVKEYIRMGEDILGNKSEVNADIEGDVFEALFGALYIIGESLSEGYGDLLTSRLLKKILRSSPIDLKNAYQNPKTLLTQNLLYPAIEITEKHDGLINKKIYIPYDNIKLFEFANQKSFGGYGQIIDYFTKSEKVQIPTKKRADVKVKCVLMGQKTAYKGTDASRLANLEAIKTFNDKGINHEKLNQLKKMRDISNPQINILWTKANEISLSEGYELTNFKAGAKLNTKNGKCLILYGKKKNDKSDTPELFGLAFLYTGIESDKGNINTKIRLLKAYIAIHSK